MAAKHILIIGGSVTGLGAALALSAQGHRVTVLEADSTPLPESPLAAFESWDRRGSPQTRHSHAFLARLHNWIRDREPALYQKLLDHGADLLRFTDIVGKTFENAELEPEDEDITLLACRRITFEWVLRRFVLDEGRAEFRDGVKVAGLIGEPATADTPPRVSGVRLDDGAGGGESLTADLVVDATGRRSVLGRWLEELGARPMRQDTEPCGIFYSSRFYRIRKDATPPVMEGAIGADLGYMKYGIFQADDGIFSITLAASPEDDAMRRVLRVGAFEAAARSIPAVAAWVDSAVSEPISDVHAMGKLQNTRRYFVDDGAPLALGVIPIGDALIHTNPINGRGCTLGIIGAQLLADALETHPDDALALALEFDRGIEREIVPWYEAGLAQDRDAMAVDAAQREGSDPFEPQQADGVVDPRAYMRSLLRDGLIPALREDLHVLRVFMRMFNLLEAPSDLLKRGDIMQRVIASYQKRGEREPVVLGPTRGEMVTLLKEAA